MQLQSVRLELHRARARQNWQGARSVWLWPGHVSAFGNDRTPGTSCPGQTMTDAMLTKPSPPGKACWS